MFRSTLEPFDIGMIALLLIVPSLPTWEGHDNLTVVLGLDARLGGNDFRGLLLGDGAERIKKHQTVIDIRVRVRYN